MASRPLALAALALIALCSFAWMVAASYGTVPVPDAVRPDTPSPTVPAAGAATEPVTAPVPAAPTPAPATAPPPRVDVADLQASTVHGRVVGADGDPVAGAQVSSTIDGATHRARTSADGSFDLALPAAIGDRATLYVQAAGHRQLRKPLGELAAHHEVGELRLRAGAVLKGRVVDASGDPVPAAVVRRFAPGAERLFEQPQWARMERAGRVGAQATRTDEDGRFALPHVSLGDYVLRVVHDGFRVGVLRGDALAAGEVRDGLLVVLRRGLAIRGRVTGLPDALSNVWLLAQDRSAWPARQPLPAPFSSRDPANPANSLPGMTRVALDGDGGFVLDQLAKNDSFTLWALHRDASGRTARCSDVVEASAGEHGVVLRYRRGVTIEFRIVDAVTGEPLERASVRARLTREGLLGTLAPPLMSRGRRDWPDGRVAITHVHVDDARVLQLAVRARGYADFEREDIAMPVAGTLDLGTIRLTPRR